MSWVHERTCFDCGCTKHYKCRQSDTFIQRHWDYCFVHGQQMNDLRQEHERLTDRLEYVRDEIADFPRKIAANSFAETFTSRE